MQRTLTVKGRRYTALQIAKLMDATGANDIGMYHITLNGVGHYAEYRHGDSDGYFAPTCTKVQANCIRLERGQKGYLPEGNSVWIIL